MALDASIGGVSANSYALLAEADAYFLESFGKSSWTVDSPVNSVKENLLIESTRIIDTYYKFVGTTASDTQSLKWPRDGAEDDSGRYYSNTEIPSKVKIATYEMAYYILEANGFKLSENDFEALKVGSIQINYNVLNSKSRLPKIVINTLSSLGYSDIVGSGGVISVKLIRT
jgi:hypothetical protein